MLRVALDTNVIVSGLITGSGCPWHVLEAFRRGEFTLLVSEALLGEVAEVLARPFFREKRGIADRDIAAICQALRTGAVLVSPGVQLGVIEEDPDDDRILECAVAGGADYVVSGDRHLLTLRRYGHTLIVSAREFLAVLVPEAQAG